MHFSINIFKLLEAGGVMMIPLSILFILALALIFDKFLFYKKFAILPNSLFKLIETYNFSWQELTKNLTDLPNGNIYKKFFIIILKNRKNPVWWIESRTEDEAKLIEKNLNSQLWILETITTVAPLLGLLGTIVGMMSSFRIIGVDGLVNPSSVTAGVAESLIATGFGLAIAIITLFAYNYFSNRSNQELDQMERLATKIIDHIKIDASVKK